MRRGGQDAGSLAESLVNWWRERGLGRGTDTRELEVIETLPLGGRRQLLRVRCGDREFLLGAGATEITCIEPLGTRPHSAGSFGAAE